MGVFVQAPTQGVVAVNDAQLVVFKAHQPVEQVPVHTAELAVVQALDLVAAFVVFVVSAGVFAQQVVHQFVALGVLLQRSLNLLSFFVEQVARRVEGEGFHTQTAGGFEQSAHHVVAVGQGATAAVSDVGQLACGIVFVPALGSAD